MNEKPETKIEYISPLKKICMTIGQLPTAYIETMSYYEMLIWFVEFLKNKVIPTIDNNALAVQELQSLYEELRTYVNNYFDNLDVQDEINNKLDQMVEDGTLQEIIADYLNSKAVFGFDNVASMKESTNLLDGSYAKTLGYHTKNDGGEALYKIRTITNDDVVDEATIIEMTNDNTLIAELIANDKINIKQLGAKGDGITDDTLLIQTAINKFNDIYIPLGDYLITQSLNINLDAKYIHGDEIIGLSSIQGKGKSNIIVSMDDIGIKVNYPSGQQFKGCKFEGFSVIASNNAVNGSNAIGLSINNWNHCTIENCGFYNFQNGKGLEFTNHGQYSNIINCKFADCKYCYYANNYGGNIIDGCMFDGNRNGSDNNSNPRQNAYALYFSGGAVNEITNTRIQGFSYGIYFNNIDHSTINKCRFEMFNHAITFINSDHNEISGNCSLNRYLGNDATKIGIEIDTNSQNNIIQPIAITSCQPVPIVNNGINTKRNDINTFKTHIGTISETTTITLDVANYQSFVSRLMMSISNSTPITPSSTAYWTIGCNSRKTLFYSTNTELNNTQAQEIYDQATSSSGNPKTYTTITFTKHGNVANLENVYLTGELERY